MQVALLHQVAGQLVPVAEAPGEDLVLAQVLARLVEVADAAIGDGRGRAASTRRRSRRPRAGTGAARRACREWRAPARPAANARRRARRAHRPAAGRSRSCATARCRLRNRPATVIRGAELSLRGGAAVMEARLQFRIAGAPRAIAGRPAHRPAGPWRRCRNSSRSASSDSAVRATRRPAAPAVAVRSVVAATVAADRVAISPASSRLNKRVERRRLRRRGPTAAQAQPCASSSAKVTQLEPALTTQGGILGRRAP